MARQSVLVIEDEENVRDVVDCNLVKEGFLVTHVTSGEAALELVDQEHFDLILLDLVLPGLDGLSLCQRLRKSPRTQAVPIVVLTARNEESDIVAGLNLGADDYVTKPFSAQVLVARIRAVLRRAIPRQLGSTPPEDMATVIEIRDLSIDSGRHCVCVGGRPVELTVTQFGLLSLLATHPGRVFTRRQIIDGLQGADSPTTDRAVDVQIVGLRRKLGSAGQHIKTVGGSAIASRSKEFRLGLPSPGPNRTLTQAPRCANTAGVES